MCEALSVDILCRKGRSLRVIAAYNPHTQDLNSLKCLLSEISDMIESTTNYVILGDINLPEFKWNDKHSNMSQPNLTFQNFINYCTPIFQLITEPTRGNHILDIILTNKNDSLSKITSGAPIGNSDHMTIFGELNHQLLDHDSGKTTKRATQFKRDFINANYQHIGCFLKSEMGKLPLSGNANDYWNSFKSLIVTSINKFIPIKPMYEYKNKVFPSFMLPLYVKAHRSYRKWTQTKKEYYYNKYKLLKSHYKAKLFNAQKKKESALLLNHKSGLYKLLKQKLKTNNNIKSLTTSGGTDTSELKIIAEEFNNYFISVYDSNNFKDTDIKEDSHDRIIISRTQVRTSVTLLRRSKGFGVDGIPMLYWTNTIEYIDSYLSVLFTMFCNHKFVPDEWHISVVRPLYKRAGDVKLAKNYRPISNLCTLLRVFERSLLGFLENVANPNICPLQYGFTKCRSTTNNLLDCYYHVEANLDLKIPTTIVTIDFAKAFDKVNLKILLDKCLKIGMSHSLVGILKCLLYNRKQIVLIDGFYSTERRIPSGVPQGSILSPILFKIYTNDLFMTTFNHKILGFADDIKHIGPPGPNLQLDLTSTETWAIANHMVIVTLPLST